MTAFIQSSALTRLLANIFIFLLIIGAGVIGFIEVLNGQPVNNIVYVILSSGITYATNISSVHSGAWIGLQPPPVPIVDMTKQTTSKLPAIGGN